MKYRRTTILVLVGFISFVSGGWMLQRGGAQTTQTLQKARLFQRVLQLVSDYYVDSLTSAQLYEMAIDGMLDQLNDPYTSFLRKQGFQELSISTTGSYGGVGLRIDLRDGWVTVVTPIADSPAERAGLESGDQIVEIEGKTTEGWSTEDAAAVLRGEPGTETSITVSRAGYSEPIVFPLTRAEIHVNSVEGVMMISPQIGYFRLVTVSEESSSEVRAAVDSLRAMGARSLIFDLRNNPGGVLNQGVELADLFLDRNNVIVETRGRAPGASEVYRARQGEAWPDMPVVALVNRATASAAEILAGALQDHDRAVVLGEPTFGKGVAYFFLRLTDTEAVTVTSSRWFTPSGRSIQREAWNAAPRSPIAQITPPAVTDTNQIYTTAGGREIRAGSGGIQPDIVQARDTLTAGEQAFASALGNEVGTYRNVMSRYALELKGDNAVTDPSFSVTDDMLHGVLTRMQERGIEMDEATFNGARALVAEQLGYELTRYAFGREAEVRRQVRNDAQVSRAMDLLQHASTPDELITLAAREARGVSPN